MSDQEKMTSARREFLKKAAIAGGATIATAVAGQAIAAPQESVAEEKSSKGYQETEHVRAYYRSARN